MKFFIAGPVSTSEEMKSLNYDPIGHREPEFSELFSNIQLKLLGVFRAKLSEYTVLVVNGSGTAALECVLASAVGGKPILIVSNGAFGERLRDICEFHDLNVHSLLFDWHDTIDPTRVAEEIRVVKPKFLAMVHHETSTGALNPVASVGELCRLYDVHFIVDSMSGFCGEPLDVGRDYVDVAISNTNKCLSGLPVLSFVCIRKAVLEECRRNAHPNIYYLDLFKHYDYAQKGQTPNTPQIPLFYMLDKALDELLAEGLENRFRRYEKNAKLLRDLLKEAGFRFYLEEAQMGNIVTNVMIPKGMTYPQIHDALKQRGYVIYPGKGRLEGKVLNLAHVGTLTEADVERFCRDLIDIVHHET